MSRANGGTLLGGAVSEDEGLMANSASQWMRCASSTDATLYPDPLGLAGISSEEPWTASQALRRLEAGIPGSPAIPGDGRRRYSPLDRQR